MPKKVITGFTSLFVVTMGVMMMFLVEQTVQAAGTTYYVNVQTGSDTNAGTSPATAWKTLAKVNTTQFAPGSSILFQRGQRWEGGMKVTSAGQAGAPITYGAYGTGAKPVIYAARKTQLTWTQHSGNIWKSTKRENLILLNNQRAILEKSIDRLDKPYEIYKNEQTGEGDLYIYSPSEPNAYYGNNMETGIDFAAVSIGSKQYIIVENLEIIGGTYFGITITDGGNVTVRNSTIKYSYNRGIDIRNSSNNLIEGNDVAFGNSFGIICETTIQAKHTNNKIFRNKVQGFSYSGIVINGYSGEVRTYNNEISDNISFNNGDGVYLHYSENIQVLRNQLYNNTAEESHGEGYGVGIQTGSNNTVAENSMYGNRTSGIEIWGGQPSAANFQYGPSNGNKVIRNKLYKNLDYGVHLSSLGFVDDTIVAYNLIYENGKNAILISNGGDTGTKLLNNTTYKNGGNTLFYYKESKPEIKNNLFATGGAVITHSDSVLGNNGYAGATLVLDGTGVPNDQLASKNSTFVGGVADFVNPATGDFSLKSNSPFINKGAAVGYTTDIDNIPITGLPDIGAFEYNPGAQKISPSPSTNSNTNTAKVATTILLHGIGRGGDNVAPNSVGNITPLHTQKTITVDAYNIQNVLQSTRQGTIQYNTVNGNFTGTVDMGNLANGDYTLRVKVPGFLRKSVPGIINISGGQTTQLASVALINGDTNSDNALSILDYNNILDCFSDLTTPRNCSDSAKKQTADLTDDGNVNQFDYNLFLRELSVQSGE